jgi:hypothetical protein
MTVVEIRTMAATAAATGNAMWRYATVMLGGMPRNRAEITNPRIASSRLTAKKSRVSRKVTNRTRTGIRYQRGWAAGIFLAGIGVDCSSAGGGSAASLHWQGGTYFGSAQDRLRATRAHSQLCARILAMSQAASVITRPPSEVVRQTPVSQAPNGICYAISGEVTVAAFDLERMVAAVPDSAAAALQRKAYYFVPLTVNQGDETVIADRYDVALSDNAVCHRNLDLGDSQCVFISTRLMDDKFSVAFEFYINVGHAVVEKAGVSQDFADLVWKQVEASARGETSLDAWESRKAATSHAPDAEKHKNEYLAATFSDAISIYLLSLFIDVDYYDLRERDYPLLAPAQMAERLRKVAELFPANPGFEFAIHYKRRS